MKFASSTKVIFFWVGLFGAGSLPAAELAKVLEFLRQGDAPKGLTPHSHETKEDLLALNERELAKIGAEWNKLPAAKGKRGETRAAKNSFFHTKTDELNAQTLGAIDTYLKTASPPSKDWRDAALAALKNVQTHPVTRMENPENYKEGGQVGFCFGRALYLHYLLLKSGVPQNELAKIFVLGELKFGDTFWRFHVALMVRDKAQGFLVVDPLVGEVIGYREWMEKNAAYDVKAPNGRSRFYVTDARKFMPAFGEYDAAQLKEPVLRKYFEGLVQSL